MVDRGVTLLAFHWHKRQEWTQHEWMEDPFESCWPSCFLLLCVLCRSYNLSMLTFFSFTPTIFQPSLNCLYCESSNVLKTVSEPNRSDRLLLLPCSLGGNLHAAATGLDRHHSGTAGGDNSGTEKLQEKMVVHPPGTAMWNDEKPLCWHECT